MVSLGPGQGHLIAGEDEGEVVEKCTAVNGDLVAVDGRCSPAGLGEAGVSGGTASRPSRVSANCPHFPQIFRYASR